MLDRVQQILEKELRQPALDLIAKIEKEQIDSILVVGGIQQDIALLQARWVSATIIFVEAQEFQKKLSSLAQYDLVFSNSAIQYLPNHKELTAHLFQLLKVDGVLAVQVPNALNMPIQVSIESIARDKSWRESFRDIVINYFMPSYYYEALAPFTTNISLWETTYQRVFSQYQEIIDLYAETEMKYYLQCIKNEEKRAQFLKLLLNVLPSEYKKQSNQAILFPYRRTFFIAKNLNA